MLNYSINTSIEYQAQSIERNRLSKILLLTPQILKLLLKVKILSFKLRIAEFLAKKSFAKEYKYLTERLIIAKGINASITENIDLFKNTDTQNPISNIKRMVVHFSSRQNDLRNAISEFNEPSGIIFESAMKVDSIYTEIIDTYYSSIRTLSRIGNRTVRETPSQLAKDAIEVSKNTIQKVYAH